MPGPEVRPTTLEGMLRNVERPAHVDRQHALEHVVGVVDDRGDVAEDAGVGERDVEPAEALDRGRDRSAHLRGVGHVGDGGRRSVVAELIHQGAKFRFVEVADHDARASAVNSRVAAPMLPAPPVMSAILSLSRST